MQRIRGVTKVCLAGVLILGMPSSIHAHAMWLNASDYSPECRASVVYFGWGHRYPVDDFLSAEQLKTFALVTPQGEREPLQPNPGGFLATQIEFSEEGAYVVAAELNPGFYTMWADKEGIHHESVPRTGLSGVILSLYFEQYAKALINAGGSDDSFVEEVGHVLEIVPLVNPANLKVGDRLPVRVLFKGRPARFCPVYATYAGFSTGDDFACATHADVEGKAGIRIRHHGPWLIKAKLRLPAPDELKDKCNELSYTATLTFEVD